MTTLSPSLMSNMDDHHLIRALNCEPSIMRTPVELELMARCERLAGGFSQPSGKNEMERRYECQLEQSEFRAMLIEEILALCEKPGSKKALVAAIKMTRENSYVEL